MATPTGGTAISDGNVITKSSGNLGIYIPYTGSTPTGATYIYGNHFSPSSSVQETIVVSDNENDDGTYYPTRKSANEVMFQDFAWNTYNDGVWKISLNSGTRGQLTSSAIINATNYFQYGTKYFYSVTGTTTVYAGTYYTKKPTLDGQIFAKFRPYQRTLGTNTEFTWSDDQDIIIQEFLSTNNFVPRIISSTSIDYLPYQTGYYRVVYYDDLLDISEYPTRMGLWKVYEFSTLVAAQNFLNTIIVDIAPGMETNGTYGFFPVNDGSGGVYYVVGEYNTTTGAVTDAYSFVTYEDASAYYDSLLVVAGTSTTEVMTQAEVDVLPKMFRTKTLTQPPNDVEGMQMMQLINGVSMLELNGYTMQDIYKYPTSNPMDRD